MAAHSSRRGPLPNTPVHSATASGSRLMSATAAPELTHRSATVTLPNPTTSSSVPNNDAPSHCCTLGRSWPVSRSPAASSPPATMKRVPNR